MSNKIFFEKQVLKYLSKLDKKVYMRLISKIKLLNENSIPHNAKRIVNVKEKTFRIRIGIYRVLYRLEKDKLIIIFLIDKRSKVYKN